MYRFVMIAMLFVMSSTVFAMEFGTVIDLGGTKMIVVSQEGEEIRLKPFVVKKATVAKSAIPKPEWDSKTVVTEGVKNVQECHNPLGCPQNVKTGECLEGCSEQKVHVKVEERIISESEEVEEIKNYDMLLQSWLTLDNSGGHLKYLYGKYYGTITWLCVLSNFFNTTEAVRVNIARIIYSNPKFLNNCNTQPFFKGERNGKNQWLWYQKEYNL